MCKKKKSSMDLDLDLWKAVLVRFIGSVFLCLHFVFS
jgi:hypothetical protein